MTDARPPYKMHLLSPNGRSTFCTGKSINRYSVAVTTNTHRVTCERCLKKMGAGGR